ncbi:MAG: signal peptidase I [Oscillospiraceae bacterium]|nr:signal peptidase I [Oscillospiraceae bacterium]
MNNVDYNYSEKKSSGNLDRFISKTLLPYLSNIAFVFFLLIVIFTLCFRITCVDGRSMNHTLMDGDYVLLLNDFLCGDYEQGDVIVASKEGFRNGERIIKRVIATEGQWVDINFETGTVKVDGKVLDEPYISTPTVTPEGLTFPLRVEDGCVFVLGDNRALSMDSRHPQIGQIDCREIVGKAIFIFFPGKSVDSGERDFGRIGGID